MQTFSFRRWLQHTGRKRWLISLVLVLICAGLFASYLSTVKAPQNCVTTIPVETDLQNALAFEAAFEPDKWEQVYADHTESYEISARWQNADWAALGHLDYLRYNCGLTREHLDRYAFDISLGGYEQWQHITQCQVGNLRLHEFRAVSGGVDYRIRFWLKPVNDTRLAAFQLAFPEQYPTELDTYSARLFPELQRCPQT